MGNSGNPAQYQDQRFNRGSFRTFGKKSRPLPEPPVSYSVMSGNVHIGFHHNLPPPPPPPAFAQIGRKKALKSPKQRAPPPPSHPPTLVQNKGKKIDKKQKNRAPQPPTPAISTSASKLSPSKKSPPETDHSLSIKRGAVLQLPSSATTNPDTFLSQELYPYQESTLI